MSIINAIYIKYRTLPYAACLYILELIVVAKWQFDSLRITTWRYKRVTRGMIPDLSVELAFQELNTNIRGPKLDW